MKKTVAPGSDATMGWRREWPWWALFLAAVVVQALTSKSITPSLATALAVAFLPLLPGFALLLWLDRCPPLGVLAWVRSLGWGLLVVPLVASWTHVLVQVKIEAAVEGSGYFDPSSSGNFGNLIGSILSAPVAEETLKAALALWFLCRRRALSGPWPALCVGALCAFGFGWMENALQFARTDGIGDLFKPRALLPWLHVAFALPLLLAIGFAAYLPTLSQRLALLAVGWIGSVALHGLWNWEVLLGGTEYSVAPFFRHAANLSPLVVVAVVCGVFAWERRLLRRAGLAIPGPFRRARQTDLAGIRPKREEMLERCVADEPKPAAASQSSISPEAAS